MRTRRVGATFLAAVVVFGAVVSAQEAAPKHFLWKVTSPSASEAYPLGSVDVLTKSFYPLSPTIDQAFAWSADAGRGGGSRRDEQSGHDDRVDGEATLPQGQTLDQIVSAETFAAVRTRAEATAFRSCCCSG